MTDTKEHRESVLAKVVPYFEAVLENIKKQPPSAGRDAFGTIIEEQLNVLKLISNVKGDEELLSFAKMYLDMGNEGIWYPLGLKEAPEKKSQQAPNLDEMPESVRNMLDKIQASGNTMINADDLPDELKEAIMNKAVGGLEIHVDGMTQEVEFEVHGTEKVPNEVIMAAVEQLAEIGVPMKNILQAVKKFKEQN